MCKLFFLLLVPLRIITAFAPNKSIHSNINNNKSNDLHSSQLQLSTEQQSEQQEQQNDLGSIFDSFASFLQTKQSEIIEQIETMDGSGSKFCRDTWGIFSNGDLEPSLTGSGGITRVIQGGDVVEKGACSLTLLRKGKLTAERAAAIRGRQDNEEAQKIKEGDEFNAAALSMVLHTRSPMVPTFRSDVRIFMVKPSDGSGTLAWFGGKIDTKNGQVRYFQIFPCLGNPHTFVLFHNYDNFLLFQVELT
jgi:coproporphyrinogen III oxidase